LVGHRKGKVRASSGNLRQSTVVFVIGPASAIE
jgi:hypothetical protein